MHVRPPDITLTLSLSVWAAIFGPRGTSFALRRQRMKELAGAVPNPTPAPAGLSHDRRLEMNRLATSLTIGLLLGMPLAATAQDDHASHHPQGDQAAAPPAAQGKEGGMAMMKMDRQMEKMRDLMKRIHTTQDPQERQRLMQEHMQAMQEGMKMMRGMGGMGMMGGKKSAAAGSDGHQHGEAAPGSRAEGQEDENTA